MFTPTISLIFITSESLARVDLKGHRKLSIANCWQRAMIASASPAALIATAMKLGPRQASNVWVLSSELSAQSITLPLEVTVLLAAGELDQALAIEAEGESGISATSSRVGYIKQNLIDTGSTNQSDEEHYWVTQIADSDIESMRSAVRGAGGQLVAVAHPHAAALQTQSINKHDLSQLSSIELLAEQWRDLLSIKHAWHRSPIDGVIYSQTNSLAQNNRSMPIVACMLAAGCLTAFAWHKRELTVQLTNEIAAIEKRLAECEVAAGQTKAVTSRLTSLREEVSKVARQQNQVRHNLDMAEQTAKRQQAIWSDLLDAISRAAEDDCWIQNWQSQQQQIIIHGLATDQAAVHRFVGRLDEQLQSSGWSVLPADTEITEHALIGFSITIIAHESIATDASTAIVSNDMERRQR